SAKILFPQSVEGEQLAYGDRDRTVFRGDADQFPLEVGIGPVLRLRDETVNRIIEFGGNGDGVGARKRRLDQKRVRDMADVGRPVMQRRDQPLASARNGKHAEIQTFADEVAFALRDEERQREDAAERRIGLAVAERDRLAAGVLTGAKAK